MLQRLHVPRARFAAEPDAVLAEAVLNAQGDQITVEGRTVSDADEYLGSITMDGHLLTFCNKGLERLNEMDQALERLGADRERALLSQALALWRQHGCVDFDVADEALSVTLYDLDQRFFAMAGADDSLEARTRRYVREHLDSFIVLE